MEPILLAVMAITEVGQAAPPSSITTSTMAMTIAMVVQWRVATKITGLCTTRSHAEAGIIEEEEQGSSEVVAEAAWDTSK